MTEQSQYSIKDTQMVIDYIRHCRQLGISVKHISNNTLTLELPYSVSIVGNPDTGVIHGGVLSTLLDTACGICSALSLPSFEVCPTLDLRIDYMSAAKPNLPIMAHAEVYRTTDNIIFTRGKAYQSDVDYPVAHCVATFMRLPSAEIKVTEDWLKIK